MTINNSFVHDSRQRVAVSSISFVKSTFLCDELKRAFPAIHLNETGSHLSEFKLIEFLKKADGALVGRENINDRVKSSTQNSYQLVFKRKLYYSDWTKNDINSNCKEND